jgi:hypothetical protein
MGRTVLMITYEEAKKDKMARARTGTRGRALVSMAKIS